MREAPAIGREAERPADMRGAAERGVPFFALRDDGVLINEGTREPVPNAPTFKTGNEVKDWLAKEGIESSGISAKSWAGGGTPEEKLPPIVQVRVKAPRGPAAKDPDKYTLLEYLAKGGGLKPDPDALAAFSGKRPFIPGFGPLFRPNGRSMDKALEFAVEGGYIHDEGRMTGGETRVSPRDLEDLLREEGSGNKQYKLGQAPKEKAVDTAEERHRLEEHADETLKDGGIDPKTVTGDLRERMLQIMEKEGVRDAGEAYERAIMEAEHHGAETGELEFESKDIPGWDVEFPYERGAAPPGGAEAPPRGEQAPGAEVSGGAREPGGTDREPAAKTDDLTERTAAGDQFVLPGAEQAGQGEMAQRGANAPLRPGVAQEPADIGLFGDERKQTEFFQQGPAEPFYSAVGRAVESSTTQKASPEQWLATIKNATGVKAEEMEWLGLESWLKEHKGPVSKEAVADYIRANQIQVKEVEKGRIPLRGDELPPGYELRPAVSGWSVVNPNGAIVAQGGDRATAISNAAGLAREAGVPYNIAGLPPEASRTKFESHTLPGGENYRELQLILPHTPRDQVRPSEAVVARYKPQWDSLVEQIRVAREELNQARLEMSPSYAGIMERVNKLEREQDALHAKSVDETVAESRGRLGGEPFTAGHWDEPNVLAHVRFNDRTIDGKKTLFLEEVQSDWHQRGRRVGYDKPFIEGKPEDLVDAKIVAQAEGHPPKWEFTDKRNGKTEYGWGATEEIARRHALLTVNSDVRRAVARGGVPDAPFKTTWPELAMKRMIRYAAENGYEQIAWTPGRVQAERYDLSKHIDKIEWERGGTSGFTSLADIEKTYPDMPTYGGLRAWDKTGKKIMDVNIDQKDMADHIGKEGSEKLLKTEAKREVRGGLASSVRTLEGADLKVGGEGMAGFYDKIMPAAANKVGRNTEPRPERPRWSIQARRSRAGAIDEAVGERKETDVHTLPDHRRNGRRRHIAGLSHVPARARIDPFRRRNKPIITMLRMRMRRRSFTNSATAGSRNWRAIASSAGQHPQRHGHCSEMAGSRFC
jgi:hypothetical protein